LDIADFLRAVVAEGIPLGRAYEKTLSQQSALQSLAERRPEYLRLLPTPIADQAVQEIVYLPHTLFLGSEADMTEIAAAFRKVQAHYAPDARKASRSAAPPPVEAASAVVATPHTASTAVKPI